MFMPTPPGGTILQYSVVKMCSVQMMASAMMGFGERIVRACQVLRGAGELTFGTFNENNIDTFILYALYQNVPF